MFIGRPQFYLSIGEGSGYRLQQRPQLFFESILLVSLGQRVPRPGHLLAVFEPLQIVPGPLRGNGPASAARSSSCC